MKNNENGLKIIPGNERKCIWMESGAVSFKLCNNNYLCDTCQFDMAMANRVQRMRNIEQKNISIKKPAKDISLWTEEFRNLPAGERKCRYMLMGDVPYKICPNSYRCNECSFDQMMQEKMSAQHYISQKELSIESGFYMDDDLSYSYNHMWLKLERNGKCRIGVDDFASRLLGKLNNLQLPDLGKEIEKGKFFWSVNHKYGDLDFASPIQGIVDSVNYDLLDHPDLLTDDPYGGGWLMTLEPDSIKKINESVFQGSDARAWMAEESMILNSSIHKSDVQTIHDGAIASDNISENLKKDEWLVLVKNHLQIK